MGEIFINFTVFYDFFFNSCKFPILHFQFCWIMLKIFDANSYAYFLSFALIVLAFSIFSN